LSDKLSDFGMVRQGIRGGPPFSVNGIGIDTLAHVALDRIEAEVERLRAELDQARDERTKLAELVRQYKAEVERLRAEQESHDKDDWVYRGEYDKLIVEVGGLRSEVKEQRENRHVVQAHNKTLQAENERLRALVDKQLIPAQRKVEKQRAKEVTPIQTDP